MNNIVLKTDSKHKFDYKNHEKHNGDIKIFILYDIPIQLK